VGEGWGATLGGLESGTDSVMRVGRFSGCGGVIFGSGARRIIEAMVQVDLYIKVELEIDETETVDRVAREICRQLEKIYVVRKAEVSNTVVHE